MQNYDPELGQVDEPETYCDTRKQGSAQKYDGDMSQRHRSHPERAPTDQIWDNLSTKIIKDRDEL